MFIYKLLCVLIIGIICIEIIINIYKMFKYENKFERIDDSIDVELPNRSTTYSAGYDFYAPKDIKIPFGKSEVIETGVCVKLEPNKFLSIVPRSGSGFKQGIALANTIGIIDCDYYYSDDNQIRIKITNNDDSVNPKKEAFVVEKGKAFAQGIILEYFKTINDTTYNKRNGGFGSTDKQ